MINITISNKARIIFIMSTLSISTFAQNFDSSKYKNPMEIPDTQRLPPNRVVIDDTTSKLTGGALIDTITTKPKTRFPKDIDDRKDSLNRKK